MSQEHQLKKGSTPTMILAVLAEAPRHGYAIAREIERRSRETLKLGEGALYPALRALEHAGHIEGNWETAGGGPARRVYTITESGRARLAGEIRTWQTFAEAVTNVIGGRADAEPAS